MCRRDPLNAPVDEHGWCFHHGNLYAHNSTLSHWCVLCSLPGSSGSKPSANWAGSWMRVQNNFAKMVLLPSLMGDTSAQGHAFLC